MQDYTPLKHFTFSFTALKDFTSFTYSHAAMSYNNMCTTGHTTERKGRWTSAIVSTKQKVQKHFGPLLVKLYIGITHLNSSSSSRSYSCKKKGKNPKKKKKKSFRWYW
ncbi:hypothetical protein I7I48_00828 [Histoplasma ohiense]|nr:hypothetical protein I7I48_00828 [Histoplasma ohiense (nom. inval.)]